jgi:hypothetical protein
VTDPNRDLAVRAAGIARSAGRGTIERKAGLCASVVLADTRSVASARAALGAGVIPADVRAAALDLIARLAAP